MRPRQSKVVRVTETCFRLARRQMEVKSFLAHIEEIALEIVELQDHVARLERLLERRKK